MAIAIGLLKMLLELEDSRKTGALDISNASARVRLYIEDGRIIDADEGTVGETLGRILLREKVIDQQQYNGAIERMAELREAGTPSRLGEIFVQLGILTKEQVFAALAAQVQTKALRALAWPSARFRFTECFGPLTMEERFITRAEPLILAALKLADRDALDALLVQAWDRYPALRISPAPLSRRGGASAPEPTEAERVEAFRLSDADASFAHSLDGTRTVRALLETKNEDGADHAVVLAALLFTDLLDLHAARVLPRPAVPRPASSRSLRAAAPVVPAPPSSGGPVGPETPKAPVAPLLAEKAYQSGKRLVHEGRFAEASAELRRAAKLYSAVEYELWAAWAETRADEKDEEKHLPELRKVAELAIEEDTERGFATFVLGYLARRAGDTKEADVLFERARSLDPDAIAEGWDALLRPLPFASTRGEVKALAAPLGATPPPRAVRPATDDAETVPIQTLRGLATEEALAAAREQEKRSGPPPPLTPDEPPSLPSLPSMPAVLARREPEPATDDADEEPAPYAVRDFDDERAVVRQKTRRTGRAIIVACVIAAGFGIALLLSFGNPGDYTPATDPFRDSGVDSAVAKPAPASIDAATEESRDAAYADSAPSIPSDAAIFPGADAEHGVLVTPAAAESHRIYVDGKIAGTTPPLLVIACGKHTVKIGSQGREQSVEVPCGGSVEVAYP